MSEKGEHQGSRLGEFVESLALERDLPQLNPLAVIAISAATLVDAQPPMLIEANDPVESGHFDDAAQLYHQHRTLVTLPLMQGLIYGGAFGGGNDVTLISLPPVVGATGFYRIYLRVRGICPLAPFSTTDGVEIIETLWHDNPYMFNVQLYATSGDFVGQDISIFTRRPHPHAEAFGVPIFTSESSLILNRTAEDESEAPLGAFSIDRLMGFSIRGTTGVSNLKVRYLGNIYHQSSRSEWYEGGPTSDFTFFPFPFPAQWPTVFGPSLRNEANFATDLMWRNDAALNPPSLLAPHGPMINVPAFGDVRYVNYVEVQFLGYRPEANARPEEVIDISPPILVTDLP